MARTESQGGKDACSTSAKTFFSQLHKERSSLTSFPQWNGILTPYLLINIEPTFQIKIKPTKTTSISEIS
uniref:Uncharacterized protein n=1 Tax=Parascaris equorum TaxID=6256 RepID=A0A914R8C5_PAREQ